MNIRRFLFAALLLSGGFVATPAGAAVPTSPIAAVWVEPAQGYGFLDAAVKGAAHSVDVSMYEINDPGIEGALASAAQRGVTVQVLIDSDYERSRNAPAVSYLLAHHVHVTWAPSGQIFHAKYVIIDNRRAYIGTGNFVAGDYSGTRDFWVEDTTSRDVAAMVSTFTGDVAGNGAGAVASGGLVWSPGSAPALEALFASAHHTLLIENEEMYSYGIEDALVAAAHRGVNVTVVMTSDSRYYSDLHSLTAAGVHVRLMNSGQTYIHAKVICADCVGTRGTAFVGSINYSTSSLNYNRELGVITTSPAVIAAVSTTVLADAAAGTTFH